MIVFQYCDEHSLGVADMYRICIGFSSVMSEALKGLPCMSQCALNMYSTVCAVVAARMLLSAACYVTLTGTLGGLRKTWHA